MLLGLVGIWRAKAGGSTWRAKCPPASPASCGWGFPVLRPVRHWGAMASWGPSLQLWLSPPGTCRTLNARREGGRKCEFGRGCGQNVAGKFSEREIYVVSYLHLSRLPQLHLLSVEKQRQLCHIRELTLQNMIHCKLNLNLRLCTKPLIKTKPHTTAPYIFHTHSPVRFYYTTRSHLPAITTPLNILTDAHL